MNKKKIIVFFIIVVFIFSIICQEENLAKYYLKTSFDFYKNAKLDLAKIYQGKACSINNSFPECYYLSNLFLTDIKENMALKKNNAELIIKYLNNSFFIEDYDFYKQIALIFEIVKDFDKSNFYYNKLISVNNRVTEEDFINYINMLFMTNDKTKFNLIPYVINKAKENYNSLDFDYLLLLYKINSNNINHNEFLQMVNLLEANDYSESKLLYLKIIYYANTRTFNNLYDEYINLRDNDLVEFEYKEKILYALLSKEYYLSNSRIIELLYDWDKLAQNDLKTMQLINNRRILTNINSKEDLRSKYLNFSGIRLKDEDDNGNWEEKYEFKNGLIIDKIFDINQDGIYENEITYFNNGKINEYIVYEGKNTDYKKFYLNINDQSLKFIDYYLNEKLIKRVTLIPSSYKPEINMLNNIDYKSIINNVAFIEEWNKEYTKINYFNSKITEEYVDSDNNGKYDKKIFFKNGVMDVVYRDINENGIYELYEKYEKGLLAYCNYMTDEDNGIYDYREEYYNNKIVKYWDYDKDGIFEVAVEENNNGITEKMFDINFNSKYDYIYEEKDGVLQNIYKIDERTNKIIKRMPVKVRKPESTKSKNKNWIVVSVKDLDNIKVPDQIIINDLRHLSGIYYYKNEKIYFKNSIIENKEFKYKLFLLNNVIYLIDLN